MADGKVLKIGILTEALSFDPNLAQDIDSMFVLRQVLCSPFEVPPGGNDIVPVLFESFDCVDDARTVYRAKVVDGHCFADGVPMEPRHVADSLQQSAILDGSATVSLHGDEIVFELLEPDAKFEMILSHGACSVHRPGGEHVLGTGPFQLASADEVNQVRLTRNPHYHGEIALDEIIFQVYPVDADGRPTALLEALDAGEVHLTNGVARDEVKQIQGLRKSFQPGNSTAVLYFNTESPRLADARVRQALAHLVNRFEVAGCSYSNALAYAAVNLLPRGLETANDDLGYDPVRAEELLRKPGVKTPERLSMLTTWGPRPYLPHPGRVTELIEKTFAKAGIEVTTTVPGSSAEFVECVLEAGFDLTLAGWAADTLDPCDFLESNLRSDRVPTLDNLSLSTNFGRFANQEMDAALRRFRSTRSLAGLEEIMQVLSDEAPLVPLIYGSTATISSFQVTRLLPSPMSVFSVAGLDLQEAWS